MEHSGSLEVYLRDWLGKPLDLEKYKRKIITLKSCGCTLPLAFSRSLVRTCLERNLQLQGKEMCSNISRWGLMGNGNKSGGQRTLRREFSHCAK
jgi:hypothetical protein